MSAHCALRLAAVSLLLALAAPAGALATTLIEVNVDGTFTPLDKAIAPTPHPTIRVTPDPGQSLISVALLREDGRAGVGGSGKFLPPCVGPPALDCLTQVSLGVYQGTIETIVGRNQIAVQTNASFAVATMVNYSRAYEDTNGNGALDGEEDANDNDVLDSGEDVNGNQLLDFAEDFNDNGALDVREDLDNDGQLDVGEDLNGNGVLDATVTLPADALPETTGTVMHPMGFGEQATTLVLGFKVGASNVAVGNYFRSIAGSYPFDLEPLGLRVDSVTADRSFYVTARIVGDTLPHEAARMLQGQAAGDYTYPPLVAPAYPLAEVLVDSVAGVETAVSLPTVPAERMPTRLLSGAAPNVGQGYEAAMSKKGGFDDNLGNPDELDLAWQHFFTQTFAAHRLIDYLLAGTTNPNPRRLAIIDTGFGNATGVLPDVDPARIADPRDQTETGAAGRKVGILYKVRDGFYPDAGSHGTWVTELCCGDGASRILGTARRSPIRPIRTGFHDKDFGASLDIAAMDKNTAVINMSLGHNPASEGSNDTGLKYKVVEARGHLADALQKALKRGMIIVVAAGNFARDTELQYPAVMTVPRRDGTPVDDDNKPTPNDAYKFINDPDESPQVIAVGPTGLLGMSVTGTSNSPDGAEHYDASDFATGARMTMTAPGQWVRSLQAGTGSVYTFSAPIKGSSFAAPLVSGAIIELINVAEAMNTGLFSCRANDAAHAACNQRVADIVVATGDDLGTTSVVPLLDHVNDAAGNGGRDDNDFGWGRLNMWKAALSVANKGLAAQHGRTASQGMDTTWTRLPLISDAQTQWYGFEIITSERQATAWINGAPLRDVGPDGAPGGDENGAMPLQPEVTAYKGVRSDTRMERGVHTEFDGFKEDPIDGTAPGRVVEENPLTGIVPLGTHIDERGQYVMTFSIRRQDLYDGVTPRTLSLRRRGENGSNKPFFNLRLDTAEMRTGRVSGVAFDDFVYQVAVPDYGDANVKATPRDTNGARHNDSSFEWLGRLGALNLDSVTAEHNAQLDSLGGDATVDVDGVMNRESGRFQDRDGRDDGVVFYPLTYKPGGTNPGKVRFTIGVADAASPRYANDADHSLYVNLWIDWNGDGNWTETGSEHVINGLQIHPADWTFGGGGATTTLIANGGNSAEFESRFPVGDVDTKPLWARMRLDYGENVGRNDPRPLFRSLPSLRGTSLTEGQAQAANQEIGYAFGAARFGEVEDYLIASDFGDAADVTCAVGPPPPLPPNTYPTCKPHMGARHLDLHREWLGERNPAKPNATREVDANDAQTPGTDEDGTVPNLKPENTDIDDGVTIPPLKPGEVVVFTVKVAAAIKDLGGTAGPPATNPRRVGVPEDAADSLPRYGGTPERKLYISGWADWDGSGSWQPSEKIIDDIQDPTQWGGDGVYTLGETFTDNNENGVYDLGDTFTAPFDQFGEDLKALEYSVTVPNSIAPRFYMRFRVAYGEDESTVNLLVREDDEDGRLNDQDKGGALCGEVEDHLWQGVAAPKVPAHTNGKINQSASSMEVTWAALSCPAFVNYDIVYGLGSQFPIDPTDPYPLTGAQCNTGSPPYIWNNVPDPSADPSHLLWWLVIANDGLSTEGTWGTSSSGFERNGPGPSGSSAICTFNKNPSNICGP